MTALQLIFLLIAAIAKSFADTINFHWRTSVLERWSEQDNWFGQLLSGWVGPIELTWQNKNKGTGVLRLLRRTVLAPFSDGWHFSDFLMLTAFEAIIAIELGNYLPFPRVVNILIYIIGMKVFLGVTFETFYGFLLVDNKEQRALARMSTRSTNKPSKLRNFTLFLKDIWYVLWALLVGGVFGLIYVAVYVLKLDSQAWISIWILVAAVGFIAGIIVIHWAKQPVKVNGST